MSDLLAGKFTTPEELENSYKKLKNSYDGLATKKNSFVIPEEYDKSNSLKFVDENIINEAEATAKKLNFTQQQFEDLTLNKVKELKEKEKKMEEQKKSLEGIDNIEEVKKYVVENIGISESSFNKLNSEEIKRMKVNYENSLKTKTQVNSPMTQQTVSRKDLYKKLKEAERSPNKSELESILNIIKHLND